MFNADTRRIARFHELRQVLHFPKRFMAPLVVFRPDHRPSVDSPVFAFADVPSFRDRLSTSWRSSSPGLSASTRHNRSRAVINGPGKATIGRFLSGDPLALPGNPSRRSSLSKSFRLHSRASQAYSGPTATSRRDLPGRQPGQRAIHASPYRHGEMPRSRPLAPDPIHSAPQGFREFLSTPAERTFNFGTGETVPGRGVPLPSQQHLSNKNDTNQNRSLSPDPDGSVNEHQPQRVRSSVATLHIDGSVLGRWAVQHLERTLGRPATGMSGVDPRATTPRSRIAPF
jgi:hypothetical protein